MSDAEWSAADPFDLPDWVGTVAATWAAQDALDQVLVRGEVVAADGRSQPLDLVCADAAYPTSPLSPELRHDAHQAWQFEEALLVRSGDRPALAVPTAQLDANRACEAMRRFAKAVGAGPDLVSVTLRLWAPRRRSSDRPDVP